MRRSLLSLPIALALLAGSCAERRAGRQTIEFWGLGREGEVVAQLVSEFERRNPGIRVDVQQIPWTAAHEKLLTANVGESLPDVAQMGNTWIPEFVTIGALEPLQLWVDRSTSIGRDDYFEGIWQTNIVDGQLYGVPWYVDTRVLFYRKDILARAGFDHPPHSWSAWVSMMERMKETADRKEFWPILIPTNEWPQPVILALQKGATMVDEKSARSQFRDPKFVSGLDFYLSIFRRGFSPVLGNTQIANLHQQFGEGEFAMFISGPWNVGELRRRLPDEMQSNWATAPMPAPDGTPYPGVSLAGGSSLVLSRRSEYKEAAWKFIEFLSEPAQQIRLYDLSGDLPARKSAWKDKTLANDDKIAPFREQLDHTAPMPRLPEWEHIATTLFEQGELAARQGYGAERAAELLDRKVNQILSKRRWVTERERSSGDD